MDWLFGILFLIAAAICLAQFRARSRADALLDAAMEKIERSEDIAPSADGTHAPRLARIAQGQHHLRRQRELSEANLQIILSSMSDGVSVVDSRHAVRLVNPALRKMFDLPDGTFGQPLLETLREPAVDDMITGALADGEPRESEIEIAGRRPALILLVIVTPMRDATGEPGALVTFRDITRLTRLEQVRREFVANVSHELRTPLAIFQGYVENLVDAPDMPRDQRIEACAILEKHSHRLNALVEDLLILARLEARREELEPEPLDFAAFLAETARDWAVRMGKKNVTLRLDTAPGLPSLHADRMRLEQVFNNLLDNALKYTPPGETIILGAVPRDGDIEAWVSDHGSGILSSDLPHIFERFYRADKARSRELGGTGLGLSIVKHIVQAHGGTIGAESTFGKGTTIRLRLPLGEAEEQET